MKSKITFALNLQSKSFSVPFQFKNLSDVNPEIFEQIISDPKHEYYVKSNVKEEVLKSFIDFWVQGVEPEITIGNYYQYCQLSQEFSLMSDFLSSSKSKWSEYEQNIYILNDPTISDKHIIESKVAQNLDDYIENQGEYLMRLSIQTLYNIFSNKNKKFTKHDRTYELIHQRYIENQDSNVFILLNFIDGQKIGIGHFTDSIINSEQRYGYMPKFDLSFINEIQKLKEKNERQDEVIQELKKNCEEQKKEIERLTNDIQKIKENQEKENKELRDLIFQIKSQNDQLQGELNNQKERQDNQQKSIEIININIPKNIIDNKIYIILIIYIS